MYIYIYTFMYMYMYMYICIYVCIYIYINTQCHHIDQHTIYLYTIISYYILYIYIYAVHHCISRVSHFSQGSPFESRRERQVERHAASSAIPWSTDFRCGVPGPPVM